MVKVLWLDAHGDCLWWNRIKPDKIENLTAAWEACADMEEIVDGHGMEKGVVLQF
jgi:hypothetical protein